MFLRKLNGGLASALALVLPLALAVGLSGCLEKADDAAGSLNILAGSEIQDLEALRPQMEAAAGMPVKFTYSGSISAVESLEEGATPDAVWLSHGKYLQQTPALKPRIKASERTMASPVVLGVKRSKAAALGWDKQDPTWGEVAKAAASGKLNYAMTSPSSSNTGFTALVGIAAALAGTGDALSAQDIKSAELAALFKGQKFIAGSSGWLAESFASKQDSLDGMINYESVILQLNKSATLREPLVLVYPKEGIVTADYPLMLLNEAKRDAYAKLVAFLREPETQARIGRETLRRPVVAGVAVNPLIPQKELVELPFPASRKTMDDLLDAYQERLRRPASTYFVLDTSGSMKGDGMDQLQAALADIAGGDVSLTGRFARLQPREKVFLQPFSDELGASLSLTMPEVLAAGQAPSPAAAAALTQVRTFGQDLRADGGTAIFSALKSTYQKALADKARDPDRQYGIVLMTDGKNAEGLSTKEFMSWHAKLDKPGVPVFVVLFGAASETELAPVATATGGRVFDGRKGLRAAFKQIRGYL